MVIRNFEIPDVKLLVPKRFTDVRGYFSETWSDQIFRQKVSDVAFVQDNQSVTATKGTLRGMHFQKPPFAQGKLVRVVRGSILDIAVDIRQGSPTYGQHIATRLDQTEGAQLWVPPGFLHGFCTLEDQTEVFYKVTAYYNAEHDAGVLWSDPDLRIDWPFQPNSILLSDKDRTHPRLAEIPSFFVYKG